MVEGITLKGNFEQRRTGWGNEENKPSCFECGSTEHFKALCPIWLAKRRKIAGIPAPSHNQNEKGKGKGKERKASPKMQNLHVWRRNRMKKIMKNKK